MALTVKPTKVARWNTDLTNHTEPSSGKKDVGWTLNEPPAGSFWNWLLFIAFSWFTWFNDRTSESGGSANFDLHAPAADTAADNGGDMSITGADAGGNAATTGGGAVVAAGNASDGVGGKAQIFGGDSAGTDIVGGDVTIETGESTGNKGASVELLAATAGASGAGINSPEIYLKADGLNEIVDISKRTVISAPSGSSGDALAADASSGTGHGALIAADLSAPSKAALLLFPQDAFATTRVKGGLQTHSVTGKIMGDDGDDEARYVAQMKASIVNDVITTTGSEQAFLEKRTIPADKLRVGSTIRIKAWGLISAAVGLTATTVRVRIGGIGGLQLYQETGLGSRAGDWLLDVTVIIRVVGGGANSTYDSGGSFGIASASPSSVFIDNRAASTLDLTGANDIVVTFDHTATSINNTMRGLVVDAG